MPARGEVFASGLELAEKPSGAAIFMAVNPRGQKRQKAGRALLKLGGREALPLSELRAIAGKARASSMSPAHALALLCAYPQEPENDASDGCWCVG
jgi:hypothetical protein